MNYHPTGAANCRDGQFVALVMVSLMAAVMGANFTLLKEERVIARLVTPETSAINSKLLRIAQITWIMKTCHQTGAPSFQDGPSAESATVWLMEVVTDANFIQQKQGKVIAKTLTTPTSVLNS